MLNCFLTLLCVLAFLHPSITVNAAQPAPTHFDRATDAHFSLTGPIEDQISAVQRNWLLRAPDQNPAMLGMFADREKKPYRDLLPWSGEFAGKYLTACTQLLRITHDKGLAEYVQKLVDRLVALQDDDGYLGPFPKTARLTGKAPNCNGGTWDAWGHYHIMIGLLLWHEKTGDANALRCAEKIGDLLCNSFLKNGKRVFDMGSPDQNQAIVHSLCLLHEKTGEQRYLDLAKQIVSEFEIPGAGDYRRTALAGKEFYATPKPRWESLHAIMGLAELYRITGNQDDRKAFEQIWWSIAKLDRHNNGGFSSGEQAVGNPYDPKPIETCCTIAWIATSVEMLRLSGNSVVADEIELSTLNSVVGSHSPDGKWTTYNTPMDGKRIANTVDIAFQIRPGSEQLNCCSVNAARGFGMISDWALMRESAAPGAMGAVVLNWYGAGAISTKVGDVLLTLKQQTSYPRDEHIDLLIEVAQPVKFPLKLRVPHWSASTKVAVNGIETAAKPASYCTIDREWKSGDRISIDLDMSLRAWTGQRECADKVSLYRGPLLLAWEETGGKETPKPAPPSLDLTRLKPKVVNAGTDHEHAVLLIDVADVQGHTIHLRDFGSAGQDHRTYRSWLVAKGGQVTPFSPENPLRTVPIMNKTGE